jgi:hypothetical protein
MFRLRLSLALLTLLILTLVPGSVRAAPAPVSAAEAAAIATDAYTYAYPLVLMELTRRVMSNAGAGAPAKVHGAPMNQFAHQRTFPDAAVTDGAFPNTDTLSSSLWFDVGSEPLVISIPDAGGRYYALPMLDMWSDVFASPGTRTTGNGPQTYALTAPGWTGMLPAGVERIGTPTNVGWINGRMRANGPADYQACHQFQDGLRAVPLSHWGDADYTPPPATYDPSRDMTPPAVQILKQQVGAFFTLFAEISAANPPHANDYPILQRMARIGLVPGRLLDLTQATPEVETAFQGATMAAASRLFEGFKRAGARVSSWRLLLTPMGTYGTDYLRRQVMAYSSLGAVVLEDTFAPSTIADVEGKPLDGAKRYTLHFAAEQLPPVNAFWSLTLYTEERLFAANSLHRFALGSHDSLTKNPDGSLDLYLQHATPGADKERNWLPTPADSRFLLTLRLYWPKPEALDGTWLPPAIVRVPD